MKVLSFIKDKVKCISNFIFNLFFDWVMSSLQIIGIISGILLIESVILPLDFVYFKSIKIIKSDFSIDLNLIGPLIFDTVLISMIVVLIFRSIIDFLLKKKSKVFKENVYKEISTQLSLFSPIIGILGTLLQLTNSNLTSSLTGKVVYSVVFGLIVSTQNLTFVAYFKTVISIDNNKIAARVSNIARYKIFSIKLKREIKKTTKIISCNEILGRRLFKSLISDLISDNTKETMKLNSGKEEAFMDVLYDDKMINCTDAVKRDKIPTTKMIADTLPLVEKIHKIL